MSLAKDSLLIIKKYGFILIMFFYAALILYYFDFVPFFDGGNYFSGVIGTVKSRFDFTNFSFWGHPCIFYFFYLGLFQLIDPGNVYLLHLSNIILGLLGIFAFSKILQFVFPNEKLKGEIYLIAATFAFYPVFTASTLNLNLDFGLTCFFLLFLYSLFYRKNPLFLLLFSMGMVFTKEPGIILYFFSVIYYCIFFITRENADWQTKLTLLTKKIYLILPAVLFGAYFLYKKNRLLQPAFWGPDKELSQVVTGLFNFNILDKNFLSYAAGIFVLNFNWIMSFFLLLWVILKLISIIFKTDPGAKNLRRGRVNGRAINMLVCLFASIVYLFINYQTFINVRYFLPIYCLLIIIFYYATVTLIDSARVRRAFLLFTFALIFFSNFRTIDPLSKLVFGTFKFGEHEMLYMTSISEELPPYGRDQIVYNLEYTNIDYLLNSFFRTIKPDNETTFFRYQWTDWGNLYSPLSQNYKRAFKDQIIYPRYLDYHVNLHHEEILNMISGMENKPKIIYYIDLPIFRDSQSSLFGLLEYLRGGGISYRVDQIKPYERDGYKISIFKLKLSET